MSVIEDFEDVTTRILSTCIAVINARWAPEFSQFRLGFLQTISGEVISREFDVDLLIASDHTAGNCVSSLTLVNISQKLSELLQPEDYIEVRLTNDDDYSYHMFPARYFEYTASEIKEAELSMIPIYIAHLQKKEEANKLAYQSRINSDQLEKERKQLESEKNQYRALKLKFEGVTLNDEEFSRLVS